MQATEHEMLGPEFLIPFGRLYTAQQSQDLFIELVREAQWEQDFVAFGRRFTLPRQQAWFADEGVSYRYSSNMLRQQNWTATLLTIKHDVESCCGHSFNSVLLTHYRDGQDTVDWHADDERELGDAPVIASLSLGACRDFCYRHKQTQVSGSLPLQDGDLIVMQPLFQQQWEHCVPLQPEISTPRLNLTFRQVVARRD